MRFDFARTFSSPFDQQRPTTIIDVRRRQNGDENVRAKSNRTVRMILFCYYNIYSELRLQLASMRDLFTQTCSHRREQLLLHDGPPHEPKEAESDLAYMRKNTRHNVFYRRLTRIFCVGGRARARERSAAKLLCDVGVLAMRIADHQSTASLAQRSPPPRAVFYAS